MDVAGVVDRVGSIAAARDDESSGTESISGALTAVSELRSWLAASEAVLTRRLRSLVSFPEQTISDCSRTSVGAAGRTTERTDTLESVPSFADALDCGDVTPEHVDAITRVGKSLDGDQRRELFDRAAQLLEVARVTSVDQFRRRLALEARSIRVDNGLDRLARQRRATRLRTWTDDEGMWRLDGRFDPEVGVRLAARLDTAVETLFAEATPDTCPVDPVEKQRHLRALALTRLVCDDSREGVRPRSGRPEFVAVIDVGDVPATVSDNAGRRSPTSIDWGIPVEVPHRVLAEWCDDGEVHPVVVRDGVVIHAPGQLDLGRSTRLASRAQRRALRGLYRTCSIPGCEVHYDRCKLHHVVWWRRGGRTDLDNLLPLCTRHHVDVHEHGWELTLGPQRTLVLRLPDGTVRNTGPPSRRAA